MYTLLRLIDNQRALKAFPEVNYGIQTLEIRYNFLRIQTEIDCCYSTSELQKTLKAPCKWFTSTQAIYIYAFLHINIEKYSPLRAKFMKSLWHITQKKATTENCQELFLLPRLFYIRFPFDIINYQIVWNIFFVIFTISRIACATIRYEIVRDLEPYPATSSLVLSISLSIFVSLKSIIFQQSTTFCISIILSC